MPLSRLQLSELDRLRSLAAAEPNSPLATSGFLDTRRAQMEQSNARIQQKQAGHKRLVNVGRLASIAPLGVAAGAALAGGGSAAAAGGAAAKGTTGLFGMTLPASSVTAPLGAASKFSLGSLLKLAEVGVPAVTQAFGMRSNNRAMDRQFNAEQQTLQQQLAFAQEQEAYRRSEAERVANEERRRWEIDQANRAKELAALEEQRAFDRRLIEEREARRQQARFRLQDFLRMGR